MGGSEDRWSLLRRRQRAPRVEEGDAPQGNAPSAPEPVALPPAAASSAPSLPRPPTIAHHWLSVLVARSGPAEPVPIGGARVVARPFPRGTAQPGAPIARATTAPDGTTALLLPPGRYALSASDGGEGRSVTVSLEHAGRATILLEPKGRRVSLQVEVAGEASEPLVDAPVEARAVPSGALAGRTVTDVMGVAVLDLAPGAYEVRVGDTVAKTYVETDTLLRLTARSPTRPLVTGAQGEGARGRAGTERPALTRYAQRAREAVSYVAPFDVARIRDDIYN